MEPLQKTQILTLLYPTYAGYVEQIIRLRDEEIQKEYISDSSSGGDSMAAYKAQAMLFKQMEQANNPG